MNIRPDIEFAPKVDFHCHVLPGIDDGSSSPEVSAKMLEELKAQGIEYVVASPHFYLYDDNAADFLGRRSESYRALMSHENAENFPKILTAAEVVLAAELSKIDLHPYCIAGTNMLLLELPYQPLNIRLTDEIDEIIFGQGLIPVFAHIERYFHLLKKDSLELLLSYREAIFQINNNSLTKRFTRKKIDAFAAQGAKLILGSDAHNISSRPPNFNLPESVFEKNRSFDNLALQFIGSEHRFLKHLGN